MTFFAPATEATIWSKSLLLRVPSCDSHAVCSFLFDPIIQSNRENATPFSGTSPLASYKEVPSPPLDTGVGQVNHSEILGGQEDSMRFFK